MNRVLKLFRPNGKLSDFNNLSLKIVYGFAATLRITLDKHNRGNHHKQELLRITRTNHKARHAKIRSTLNSLRKRTRQDKLPHIEKTSLGKKRT